MKRQNKKSVKHITNGQKQEDLIIPGQGVVSVVGDVDTPFIVKLKGRRTILLSVSEGEVKIVVPTNTGSGSTVYRSDDAASCLDEDANCPYWMSLDSINGKIRYGKGEVRLGTCLLEGDIPQDTDYLDTIKTIEVGPGAHIRTIYKDPVVVDPAPYVVDQNEITMEDVARGNRITVAELPPTCQRLYGTVSGKNFELDTPDFPHFSKAIEASIKASDGWCNRKLFEKSNEFGKKSNLKETYLRITLGSNSGNSPGIPYVMEIWPPGHYSPIHDHGYSNAIIKVLHGEITVSLFPFLSQKHREPFGLVKFGKGDVAWITPECNQFHQLRNANVSGETCITIQCYMYSDDDSEHYKYFDYLGDHTDPDLFTPNSDMDFLEFKELMKKEWYSKNR